MFRKPIGLANRARSSDIVDTLLSTRPSTSAAMGRLKAGIIRYASVGAAIARALGAEPGPHCRIGGGRITLTFRGLGGSRWPEDRQIEHALHTVSVARRVLADDWRRSMRDRANRAIVVVYEDSTLVRGCAVVSRWECVVPVTAG